MPINAPQEYYNLEEAYSKEKDPEEKERILKKMLVVLPKHKGSDREFASLKRRLSLLRKASRKVSQKHKSISIRKQWPRICLIGYDPKDVLSMFKLTQLGSIYYGIVKSYEVPVQLISMDKPEKNRDLIEQADAILSRYRIDLPNKKVVVSDEPNLAQAIKLCGAIGIFTEKSDDVLAMKEGDTVFTLAKRLHMEVGKNAYALVYGKNVKFQGQRVSMNYRLNDGDRVFIKI